MPADSVRVLNQHLAEERIQFNFDFSAHFVRHPSNYKLAKHIIFTAGKTPAQAAAEIVGLVIKEK